MKQLLVSVNRILAYLKLRERILVMSAVENNLFWSSSWEGLAKESVASLGETENHFSRIERRSFSLSGSRLFRWAVSAFELSVIGRSVAPALCNAAGFSPQFSLILVLIVLYWRTDRELFLFFLTTKSLQDLRLTVVRDFRLQDLLRTSIRVSRARPHVIANCKHWANVGSRPWPSFNLNTALQVIQCISFFFYCVPIIFLLPHARNNSEFWVHEVSRSALGDQSDLRTNRVRSLQQTRQ